jgi:hypothetical protein
MKRPLGLVVVVVLAVVQGVLAFLRANQWFQVGVDLVGQGLVFTPLMGLVAIGRDSFMFCSPSERSAGKTGHGGWD